MKQPAFNDKLGDKSKRQKGRKIAVAAWGLCASLVIVGFQPNIALATISQASNAQGSKKSATASRSTKLAKSQSVQKSNTSRASAMKIAQPKVKRTFISFDEAPTQSTRSAVQGPARPRKQAKALKAPQLMFASGAVAPTSLYLPDTDEMTVTRQREDQLRGKSERTKRRILVDEDHDVGSSRLSTATEASDESKQRFKLRPSLNYSVRSDLADERDPRISTHRLGAAMSATIFNRAITPGFDEEMADELLTLSASISGQARTIGQELDGQQGGFDLADLDIAASRSFDLGDWATASHSLDAALGTNIPTSVDSQYEGVKAVPYASLGVASSFRGGRVQLLNSVTGDYVVNTYTFSPSSRQINPDASVGYTLGGSVLIASGFRFGVSATARLTHHLDESVSNGFSNQQTLSWSNKTWTVALRHSNGSRPEDRESNLWFFDQVRRMVALSVTARF